MHNTLLTLLLHHITLHSSTADTHASRTDSRATRSRISHPGSIDSRIYPYSDSESLTDTDTVTDLPVFTERLTYATNGLRV